MGYSPQTWVDDAAGTPGTTIDKAHLDHIEKGIAQVSQAWKFYVEDYGAVGDGSTDDTAAIRSALAAAVTYAQANNHYAEILFQAKTYALSSATTQGGTTKGNAQIPLPNIAGTAPKLTLVFKGVSEPSNNHWSATAPQTTGTVLKSTLTGQSYSGTYGLPSIVGAPTPEQTGYGSGGGLASAIFSNICVVVDGIQLQAPSNPTVCGWDFRGAAAARVVIGSAMSTAIPSSYTLTPDTFMSALLMPLGGNNDYSEIGQWTAFGWYCAVGISEHTNLVSLRAIACEVGIRVLGPMDHAAIVQHASVESCHVAALQYVDVSPVPYPGAGSRIRINLLDIEDGANISDASNNLFGEVFLSNQGAGPATVTGGANLRLISLDTVVGAQTAPSVPTSTTPLTNPFWRTCAVTITGGTVTAIAVAGQTLGVTSGTVIVPTGKTITLTYSAAPTWKWTAL